MSMMTLGKVYFQSNELGALFQSYLDDIEEY